MIKLLHLADLHFDTVFKSRRDETRSQLRAALRTAFSNAIDCAIKEDVDAVLISGDLFDNDNLGYATERFIINKMGSLEEAGIPVVYATGNHDPGGGTSRASRIAWPNNSTLVDRPEPVATTFKSRTSGRAFHVVAAGFDSREVDDNIAMTFPEAAGGDPYIGVLHTLVTDSPRAGGHRRYAPCSTADLASKGYTYWALGHIHVRHQINPQVPGWYAGNIQGCSPRESGAKGGIMVTIDNSNRAEISFRHFGPVIWETLDVNVAANIQHVDQLARELESAAASLTQTSPANKTMLRFRLLGEAPVQSELRSPTTVNDLELAMKDVLDALDVEISVVNLRLPADLDKYKSEPHVLGRALTMVDDVVVSPREQIVSLLGENAVVDWSGASDEMVSELLTGLGEEIAERMLKS